MRFAATWRKIQRIAAATGCSVRRLFWSFAMVFTGHTWTSYYDPKEYLRDPLHEQARFFRFNPHAGVFDASDTGNWSGRQCPE